jgi:hypothetical protein
MVGCPSAPARVRDTLRLAGGNLGAQYAREHVSRGWTQCNLRSCGGASARGSHHFAGQPCSFRRHCTYASRYVRYCLKGQGSEMRRWLRRRRERVERIESEAGELVRLLGDDAYAEARWREHTASSSASAQEWNLIASAIARQTGRRIGVDLSTPMAMNAVFAPDREPDERKLRPHSQAAPLDEMKRILAPRRCRFGFNLLALRQVVGCRSSARSKFKRWTCPLQLLL